MREILFRGKRIDNGEWIEGSLWNNYGEVKILSALNAIGYEVIPETAGQYTGLTDKNGKKIFEGDIVKSCEYDDIYLVKYFDDENYPAFDCVPDVPLCECNGLSYLVNTEGCEVTGNIHDNPQLLKEREKDNAELKPCPFCGGNAKTVENCYGQISILCENCMAKVFFVRDDYSICKEEAIKAWNRRVDNG